MSDNKDSTDAQVLHWPGKLFSADDLRRHWTGQRELVLFSRTLLTPLAFDELRAKGVRITWQDNSASWERQPAGGSSGKRWGVVQEKPEPVVVAALAALEREGLGLAEINPGGAAPAAWFRSYGGWASKNAGIVVFCQDAALVCCLANKVAKLRAVAVANALQTGRALATLGANLLVVEMPGRTFFEVRRILRTAAAVGTPTVPPEIAKLVLELEGHAHR